MQHPQPVSPGAILGYTKHGRPIRLIAGGSGEGGTDPAPTPPSPPEPTPAPAPFPTPKPAPAPAPTPDPAPTPAEQPAPASVEELPTWARKLIGDLRGESAEHRTKATGAQKAAQAAQEAADKASADRQTTLDAIAKALGLKEEDTPPDPAKLAEQLKAAQAETEREKADRAKSAEQSAAEHRRTQVQLAVYRAAGKHGADSDALLDSASFLNKVAGLDPAADDFADRLGEAITKAVEANPRLAKAEPKNPGRSGPEHTPSPPPRKRPQGLSQAVGNAYRR